MDSIFDIPLDRTGLSTMKWEAEQAKNKDPLLLCCGTADMDFRTPEPVLDAIRAVADRGHLGYPYAKEDFYQAIESWLERKTGWKVDARSCVSNNVGIYTAVWAIVDGLTDPGDEVIIQTPVHFCFKRSLICNGRIPVENPLFYDGETYRMDFDHLETCFSEKTKALWLCNPHNPVGRAWKREELEKLADICRAHHVKIISDDVYCGLTYPGENYVPISSLSEEIANDSIICYSISKTYNTTGLKHAFVLTKSQELLERYNRSLEKLDLTYGINLIGLEATTAALNQCDDWVSQLMLYIQGNYEILKKGLQDRLGNVIRVVKPEATYFAWVDLRALGCSDEELAELITKRAHLVAGMGVALGTGGEGFVRLNMGCTHQQFAEITDRLIRACLSWMEEKK